MILARILAALFLLGLVADVGPSAGQSVCATSLVTLSTGFNFAVTTTAQTFSQASYTVPTNARCCIGTVDAQPARFTTTGTAPTSTTGQYVASGTQLVIPSNQITSFSIIRDTTATANANFSGECYK